VMGGRCRGLGGRLVGALRARAGYNTALNVRAGLKTYSRCPRTNSGRGGASAINAADDVGWGLTGMVTYQVTILASLRHPFL
jgi:hypothetical protein